MIRLTAFLLAAGMACPGLAEAASAVDAVRGLYVPKIWNPLEEADFSGMTGPALTVFEKSTAASTAGDGGCIDFVVTADGQDYDEAEIAKTLKLKDVGADENGDTDVSARFSLFGEPRELLWTMREVDGAWKVADIESKTGDWRLSDITCE